MKKLVITVIFIFLGSCNYAYSQDVSLPRDVAEKALNALEVNPTLEARIKTLEKVVEELERAKQTPCSIAAEKVKTDLTFWLGQLDTSNKVKEKEILKVLKDVRKTGRKMIAKQCGDDSKSVWAQVWGVTKVLLPVGAVLIAK